jgi:formylglycine-generating enzyme required for sulfatase activity
LSLRANNPKGYRLADSDFDKAALEKAALNRDSNDNEPARYILRPVAMAYVVWTGGRLPTVEEWRLAAGQIDVPNAQWPVYRGSSREGNLSLKPRWAVLGVTTPLPVNELEEGSPFELRGLPGNLAEWVSSGGSFGIFGGSYRLPREKTRLDREPESPFAGDVKDVGIRVVWDP